ncbi:hypothetical protein ACFPU1_11615 [Thalassorhabdus alkalitolerans]|uniref:Uncharacterized protein n=1 Tax=Thalassorhabdus alkalitolerans TaxID=2282697 RepID=A0ABW0YPQ5_9BACI|nr:hypothetical protein [Bacillus sp. FJAT-44742]
MEAIIEFIFANLFIILLIVGGIISMISRQGGGNQQRGQGQGEQRKQGEIDWKEIFKQEENDPGRGQPSPRPTPPGGSSGPQQGSRTAASDPAGVEEETRNAKSEYEQRLEEIQRRKKQAEEKIGEISDSPIFGNELSSPSSQKSKVDLQFSRISKKEAMQGVIWSEVLGKPRANQPHRSASLYRRQRRS